MGRDRYIASYRAAGGGSTQADHFDRGPVAGVVFVAAQVKASGHREPAGEQCRIVQHGVVEVHAGKETARGIQLAVEYDPHPPFDSGNATTASPELKALALRLLAESQE